MARIVRCSLIQSKTEVAPAPESSDARGDSFLAIKDAATAKHTRMIRQAAADGAQIVCLQEMSNGP